MPTRIRLAVALALLAGGSGCGSNEDPPTAESVADGFIRTVGEGEFDAACSVAWLTLEEIERLGGFKGDARCSERLPGKQLESASVDEVETDRDSATVTLTNPHAVLQMKLVEMPFSETVDPPAMVWRIDRIEVPSD